MSKKFLTNIDLASNQLINFKVENLASAPTVGSVGRLFINTTSYLVGWDNGTNIRYFAPTDSPAFSGTPTAPTQSQNDNSTKLATTAYVDTAVTAGSVSDNTITNQKLSDMATGRLKGRATGSTGDPEDLTASQVRTILNVADGATANSTDAELVSRSNHTGSQAISTVTGLQAALDGKSATGHTHTASQVTDFNTAVDTRVAAYWDSIAGTDSDVDTIREVLDIVLSNAEAVQEQIARYNADIGDGSSTSIAVTHSLNSLDVTVEIYEKATGATVLCDVVRTNVNTVTIGVNPAPSTNSLRVVVKK